MKVWIRVASCIRSDEGRNPDGSLELHPGLSVTIYHNKQEAENGRKVNGGIVLQVDAASLAISDQSEFGNEVTLSPDSDNEDEGPSPAEAYVTVCFAGLPYKMVPNYGPYEPGTVEPQGDVADFGPETAAWLTELEKETGFELHQ
jgi:hypothetical protein